MFLWKRQEITQGSAQSQAAALPRHQEEEKTDKTKQEQKKKKKKKKKKNVRKALRLALSIPSEVIAKRTEKHKNKITQGKT